MKYKHPNQLLAHLRGAAASVTIMFIIQALFGFAVAAVRPDLGTMSRHLAVASALLSTLALFALTRVRAEPAIAAGIVAALLIGETAGLAAFVGVPVGALILRVGFAALVYGGLLMLAVAATCAAIRFARTRPTNGPIPARRRLPGADANRAA